MLSCSWFSLRVVTTYVYWFCCLPLFPLLLRRQECEISNWTKIKGRFKNLQKDVPKDKLNMKHPLGTELLYALESLTHP